MSESPAVDEGRILFGAAYYHEYQPTDRLNLDLDLMVEAGMNVIRIGESVWSTWEPSDGRFDLEWITPVLDGAHARGIRVILGTPTYAAPMWLARRHPEINAERSTGSPMGWGRRQEIDFTNSAFRFHAERVIRAILERHATHPAVIGVQVDNEPGVVLLHNHNVFERFVDELRHQYGTIERLNEEWGLVYWSHLLSDWSDLWKPDGNAQPQYDLAWRRFQARLLDEFIAWQAGIAREYLAPHQFVTTCYSYFARPGMDDESSSRALDVVSGNAYFTTQNSLSLPSSPVRAGVSTKLSDGAWRVSYSGDRMFSGRQQSFLVTETNASSIGPQSFTEPPWRGQWRQIAWMLVARGAGMIEYWHWHSLHFGAEIYWQGVLPHDQQPGRVYREVAELGQELRQAGDLVTGLRPGSDIAFVFSNESRWSAEFSGFLADAGGAPDPGSVLTTLHTFYRAAFESGLDARIVHPAQLLGADEGPVAPASPDGSAHRPGVASLDPAEFASKNPILVAAGLAITSDELLDWLREYAASGGHLVLGIRTGYQDTEGRARSDRKPARLAAAAGVEYAEFSSLGRPVPTSSDRESFADGGSATGWIDFLTAADDTEVVLRYVDEGFGGWPAITSTAHGAGRITTIGTIPDDALGAAFMNWLVPVQSDTWRAAARTEASAVSVTSATTRDGRILRFVHNWSWVSTSITAPVSVRDIMSSVTISAGELVELGAWDVRLLIQES